MCPYRFKFSSKSKRLIFLRCRYPLQRNFRFFGRTELHKVLNTTRTNIIKIDSFTYNYVFASIDYKALRYRKTPSFGLENTC